MSKVYRVEGAVYNDKSEWLGSKSQDYKIDRRLSPYTYGERFGNTFALFGKDLLKGYEVKFKVAIVDEDDEFQRLIL